MAKEIESDPTLGSLKDIEILNLKHQEVLDGTKSPTLEELEHKKEQLEYQKDKVSEDDLPVLDQRIEEIDLQIKEIIEKLKIAA